jgi:glycosyltransferase involved in cell wall biosynthesis
MSSGRHQVVVISTRSESESRRNTLLDALQTQEIGFDCYESSHKLINSSRIRHYLPKHHLTPHLLSIVDGFPILLRTLLSIICTKRPAHFDRLVVIIVSFNSWYFYPYAFLLSYIPNFRIIVDLGYPIMDISSIGLPEKFKSSIRRLEQFLYRRPMILLVESQQQVLRLAAQYTKPTFKAFYVLNSKGIKSTTANSSNFKLDLIEEDIPYLLFRGTLNPEAGIKNIIADFIDFKNNNTTSKLKLVIIGRGEYSDYVHKKSRSNSHIIFHDHYLDELTLTCLIDRSIAMIGQFCLGNQRLQYTIPHKYVESLKLRKLYLSPIHPPIQAYYKQLLVAKEFNSLFVSTRPFYWWLNILSDASRRPTPALVRKTSHIIEASLQSINDSSISTILA